MCDCGALPAMGYAVGAQQLGPFFRHGHQAMCGARSKVGHSEPSDLADVLLPIFPLIPQPCCGAYALCRPRILYVIKNDFIIKKQRHLGTFGTRSLSPLSGRLGIFRSTDGLFDMSTNLLSAMGGVVGQHRLPFLRFPRSSTNIWFDLCNLL